MTQYYKNYQDRKTVDYYKQSYRGAKGYPDSKVVDYYDQGRGLHKQRHNKYGFRGNFRIFFKIRYFMSV